MAYLGNTIVNGVLRAINGIVGNGSGITDINASNISTGTLNAERLPESYLPLTGGTLNGGLTWLGGSSGTELCGFKFGTGAAAANYYQQKFTSMDFGWNWDTGAGSGMAFRGTSYGGSAAGAFIFFARNSTSNYKQLEGYVDGTLKWTGSLFTVGGGTGTITGNITGNVLTGYTKPTTTSAIAATDTLNGAIGKLEKALDSKQTSINSSRSIEFITGTQTAATGAFKGVTEDTSLYDGKCINYYLPYAGSGNATLELTFPDGSTSGAKSIFIVNSTRLTTHYSAGTIFQMTYSATKDAWYCGNYWYDSNTQGQYIYYYNTAYFRTAVTSGTIAVGDATGYAQAAGGVTFNISYPMLWVNTNIAAGGTNYANCFIQHYDLSLANVKPSFTSTKWKMIYLVVTISGMTATVDSEIITDTLPSTEDGKVYIAIGRLGNQTNGKNYFLFQAMHPMYHYKNGAIRPYDQASAYCAAVNHTHNYAASSHSHSEIVTVGDKRNVATIPNDYTNKIIFQGLKTSSVIGSPTGSTYQYLVGLRGWSDSSGGKSHELAFSDSGISYRMGATTTWDAWQSILTSTSSLNAAKLTGTVPASCISGFATASHGNHVPATQTANNAIFLRNDNTWQTVTPANIGAAASSHTHSSLTNPYSIEFNGMGTSAGNGGYIDFHFNASTADYTSRIIENASGALNITGKLNVAGALTQGGTAVSLSGHTHNYAGSSSAGGAATTALKVQNNPAAGSDVDLVYSQMAANDYFRIRTGGASNAGYAELATADDGTEPIYVRQYTGVFSSLVRTATLLDGSGNTILPGSVTVGSHGTIAYNSATGCIELSVA